MSDEFYLPSHEFLFAFHCDECGGEWTQPALLAEPDDAEFVTAVCPECLGDEIATHWWEEVESDEDIDFNVS